jgi:hypothetical protein
LKQQILQQERETMRRVKIRDSMRGAMESSSAMAVSMKIASLIEDTQKECSEMMSHISSKLLVLQDRQVNSGFTAGVNVLILFRTICSETLITS